MSKQVWLQDWMIKNECAPGQKNYTIFLRAMLKWDPRFTGFWDGGTYDVGVLETQLNQANEQQQQVRKAYHGDGGQQQQVL